MEARLFLERRWPKLTTEQRQALPEVMELAAIDAQLDAILAEQERLLPCPQTTPATTRAGTLAKLDALARHLDTTDNPEALEILRSCQRDLDRLWL